MDYEPSYAPICSQIEECRSDQRFASQLKANGNAWQWRSVALAADWKVGSTANCHLTGHVLFADSTALIRLSQVRPDPSDNFREISGLR